MTERIIKRINEKLDSMSENEQLEYLKKLGFSFESEEDASKNKK